MKYFQKLSFRTLSLILLISTMAGCTKLNHKIAVGKRMPDFNVIQLSGTNGKLTSLFKGEVVLVVFWATWCSRCREEVPHINELTTHYGSSLAVIGVSVGESVQTVKAHIIGLGIEYPVVVTELSDFTKLKIGSIPRLLLLDSKGHIQQIENSVNMSLQKRIQQLVGENDSLEN